MSATTQVLIKPTRPVSPGLRFDLVGDDELTGGAGGWQDIARPRRRTAVEWVGTPAYTYVLPLMIDGIETSPGGNTVVESAIKTLTSWGTPTSKTGQPPVVRLAGPLRAPDSLRWVIDDITWGEQIRNNAGRRIQQQVTVTLKEFVEPTLMKGPAARARNRKKKKK